MITKKNIELKPFNSLEFLNLRQILNHRGYSVVENLQDKEHSASTDVMLVDTCQCDHSLDLQNIRKGKSFPIIYITEANNKKDFNHQSDIVIQRPVNQDQLLHTLDQVLSNKYSDEYIKEDRSELIIDESGNEVCNFVRQHVEINHKKTCIIATTTRFNVKKLESGKYNTIVNLRRVNDIQRINKFFETVNSKLVKGNRFIGCAETLDLRKRRIQFKYMKGFNRIYYFMDFVFKRVFPKLPVTKKIYFSLTNGRNRAISKAELLGRLYCCGFKVVDTTVVNGNLYFVAEKVQKPSFDTNPSYGPLFAMKRLGKDGKIIRVYKLRTMYPYSEYLQQYIYERNMLDEGGKFKDDFRVSFLGKIFRKFWIDELPMIYNLINGDLKLVGVRPLSNHFYSLYDKDLQDLRLKVKPGLVPPFYADMPKTLDEIQDSERRYIKSYLKNPISTDIKYLCKIFCNIVFRNARSK